jgi:hypothetical protein
MLTPGIRPLPLSAHMRITLFIPVGMNGRFAIFIMLNDVRLFFHPR